MNRKRSITIAAIGVLALAIILFMKLWPILLDSHPLISLRLYIGYLTEEKVQISNLFNKADVICAIGPYDSFRDARFGNQLNPMQVESAEKILAKQNEKSFGNNRFFMVGLKGNEVSFVYDSKFFSNMATLKHLKNALNCVTENGAVIAKKSGNTIAIELIKGE